MGYDFAATFELNQNERNDAAVEFRGRNDIRVERQNGLRFVGSYPQITGQRPCHLVEPTDIFAQRESVIVGYALSKGA